MENRYRVKEQVYASHGKRFANNIVDTVVFYILSYSIGEFVFLISDVLGTDIIYNFQYRNPFLVILIEWSLLVAYFIFCEGMYQVSVGKLATQTIVVNQYGEKPEMKDILKRSFSRLIPLEAFSFLGNNARGWHDSISKTYVVDKKLLEQKKLLFNELNKIGEE